MCIPFLLAADDFHGAWDMAVNFHTPWKDPLVRPLRACCALQRVCCAACSMQQVWALL